MTSAEKQAAYAAKRAAHTNRQTVAKRAFRIIDAQGERVERFVGMLDAAKAYPEAWQITDVEKVGGFY